MGAGERGKSRRNFGGEKEAAAGRRCRRTVALESQRIPSKRGASLKPMNADSEDESQESQAVSTTSSE